jgi:hypothetical protein
VLPIEAAIRPVGAVRRTVGEVAAAGATTIEFEAAVTLAIIGTDWTFFLEVFIL